LTADEGRPDWWTRPLGTFGRDLGRIDGAQRL
jgi:hypothetical protein